MVGAARESGKKAVVLTSAGGCRARARLIAGADRSTLAPLGREGSETMAIGSFAGENGPLLDALLDNGDVRKYGCTFYFGGAGGRFRDNRGSL